MFIRGVAPLTVCALLTPAGVSAQPSPFTATGWVNGLPTPGIICTNARGQVLLRGLVHTARIESSDARVTGQLLILGDASYTADGTAISQGTAYLQVGTWDSAKTNFTPTGGMWETWYRGLTQTDNSFQLSIAGYGSGGIIDGLRSEATLTRAAAPGPIDFTVPYTYTGTITPPPVSTTVDSDDFDGGVQGWTSGSGSGTATLVPTNQQMTLRGQFPTPSSSSSTTCAWAIRNRAWTVNDGQTLELRVDLVRLNDAASEALLAIFQGSGGPGYSLSIGHDYLTINEFIGGLAVLGGGKVAIKTNVVAGLALTRAGQNVLLTARVLDKDNQNAVIYERTVLDTPASDPSLSHAQLMAIAGVDLTDLVPDPAGPPYESGSVVWLGLWQKTDGHQPAAEATFDNFTLQLHDGPPLNVARAVQLTWPAPAGASYAVEGAPRVQGLWLPVQALDMPGIQKLTVPLSGPAQFFRLVQAP
jgi:hypothetical protein